MTIDFPRRSARVRAAVGSVRVVLFIFVALALAATPAAAQVAPAAFPDSFININTGYSGPYPYNTNWGGWFASHGSNGFGTSSFDISSNLVQTRQDITMLHAGHNNAFPTVGVINQGALEFTTTLPSTLYQIDGIMPLIITSGPSASGFVNCTLTLEQVSGPTLASYSVGQSFGSNAEFALFAFDASAPLSGSQTGSLLPATTYRMEWFFQVSMTSGGDPASNIDVDPGSQSYFKLSFVPEPSGVGVIALGAAAVALRSRRRR